MMHTIIDLNEVFADGSELGLTTVLTSSGYSEYVTVNGKKRLHRLFSTRPHDYLNI